MFDRSACAGMRAAADAHADLAALTMLAALLRHALNDRFASSNLSLLGASRRSRDRNRGEVHATQTKQTPARRRAPQQIELFTAEPQMRIGDMPAWSGLPPETQAALTGLMTRLILEHADKTRTGSMAEAGHDL